MPPQDKDQPRCRHWKEPSQQAGHVTIHSPRMEGEAGPLHVYPSVFM